MANFRQVHTKIWKDGWFLDLAPAHKLFFIYLFTNECASISGLFELPERVMMFESGLSSDEIKAAFDALGNANKAFYGDGVVWVVNMRKYHETESPKVQTRIEKDVEAVKDCELSRAYCEAYGIDRVYDRVSIPPYTSSIVSSKSKSDVKEAPKKPKRNGTGPLPEVPSDYQMIRQRWIEAFPDKPKPRTTNRTLQGKVKTRLKSPHFRENWPAALDRAAQSVFLKQSVWFDFGWFMKNDSNYEKCLNGNYDDRPKPGNNGRPAEPAAFAAVREIQEEIENGIT